MLFSLISARDAVGNKNRCMGAIFLTLIDEVDGRRLSTGVFTVCGSGSGVTFSSLRLGSVGRFRGIMLISMGGGSVPRLIRGLEVSMFFVNVTRGVTGFCGLSKVGYEAVYIVRSVTRRRIRGIKLSGCLIRGGLGR